MQQYMIKQLEYFQYLPAVTLSKGALFPQNSSVSINGYHCPWVVSVSTLEQEGSKASVLPMKSALASFDSWRLLDYSPYLFLNSVISRECATSERNYSVIIPCKELTLGFISLVSQVEKLLHQE